MNIGLTSKLLKDSEYPTDKIEFVPDRVGQMLIYSKEGDHLNTTVINLESMKSLNKWLTLQIELINEYNQG